MRPHLITRTETQGRFGNGQGQEYAEQFLVEYLRDALQQWTVYKDTRGQKVQTEGHHCVNIVLTLTLVAAVTIAA
jgi:hypothetical protein